MNKNLNEPAFPIKGKIGETDIVFTGMTLLDYFAAKCITGKTFIKMSDQERQLVVSDAYRTASLMMQERESILNKEESLFDAIIKIQAA